MKPEPVLNAFMAVRPRGVEAPSAVPRAQPIGRPPSLLHGSGVQHMAMDRNGKRLVPLAPRVNPDGFVEGREQGQASTDKRRAIVRGGI